MRRFIPRSDGARTRVVVMIDSLANPGGAERLAVENALRLDPARFEAVLCVTRWEDSLTRTEPSASLLAELHAAGVEVLGLRRHGRLSLGAWRPLVRRIREGRVDVLHAHLFGSNVWAAVLGTLGRVPAVVAHEHMWAYGGGRASRVRPFLDRDLIGRFADAFIAVSAVGRQRMIEVERVDPEKIVIVPNGIVGFPPGDGARVRAELGIDPGAPVVGSAGHLRPEKAFEVLIAAAAELRPDRPGLVVLIAGEGRERAGLEAQIEALDLAGRVRLLGARDDVPDLLAALDVAVCCSDFEGGPLSVMEYMEAGLPVVATDVGGLPELVEEGATGLLVPPRDPVALADALGRLLDDPGLRGRMGGQAREERRRRWDLAVWARRLEALYAELLARP
jgi:glycosyltransferase involved in cell wall biosynthesis